MDKSTENMRHCPAFERCNCNLCPLDFELDKRRPRGEGKCKYMRERDVGQKTIKFTSAYGSLRKEASFIEKPALMPAELLKNVPACNVESLNSVSKQAWYYRMT